MIDIFISNSNPLTSIFLIHSRRDTYMVLLSYLQYYSHKYDISRFLKFPYFRIPVASADILAHRAKQLAPCNCIVTSLKRDQKEQKGGHI